MFSYMFRNFSRRRADRAVTLGATASVLLYLLLVLIAEPLRGFAATTADTVVQFTITGALSMTCSTTSTLGSAAGNGTTGTGAMATAYCQPSTNNSLGYTLSWIIQTGSGAPAIHANCNSTNTCYGTGHLLSNNVTSGYPDVIQAFARKGSHVNNPGRFDSTTMGTGAVAGSPQATPFPVNSLGQPVSSDDVWNSCIIGQPLLLADGSPVSCARYHDGPVWQHPDLGISFTYRPNNEPPLLLIPEGYVLTVTADTASSSSASSESTDTVSSSTSSVSSSDSSSSDSSATSSDSSSSASSVTSSASSSSSSESSVQSSTSSSVSSSASSASQSSTSSGPASPEPAPESIEPPVESADPAPAPTETL